MENLPYVLENMEHEEFFCPECGDIFQKDGYKVTLMELSSWSLEHLRKEDLNEILPQQLGIIETQEPTILETARVTAQEKLLQPLEIVETQEPTIEKRRNC